MQVTRTRSISPLAKLPPTSHPQKTRRRREGHHSARLPSRTFSASGNQSQTRPSPYARARAHNSASRGGGVGRRAMAFLFGAFLGLVLGVAAVVAFARLGNSRAEQRRKLAATVSSFSKLTVQDLRKLISPEFYPSWVSFTQKQKLKWLNHELVKIWPFVNEAASELIRTSVEPIFEQYKSFILASLHFSKLTLGTVAPQFTGVSILDSDSSGITMELELQWDGNPNIVLDIQTTLGIPLPVQVKNIGFTGELRLVFKPLVAEFPCFGAVCCSLREKSKVDFTLKVIGGEMTAIPGISDAIEGTIRDTIEDTLTWPNRIIVPIVPGDYSDLELKPVGLLEVKLVEARDLLNKDLVGKSDPFAVLYIRPLREKTKKSKTINNDLNPIWNEHYEFVVEDTSTQHLTVKIYDDEGLQPSEIIGCARVGLADLQPGKVKDVWLDLVKDLEIQRDKKPRGQVHLELLYYPFGKHEGISNPFANQIQLTSLEKVLKAESNGFDVTQRKNIIMRGVLSVTVISAEDLPPMDVMGKADPFVVLYLKKGETKKKTRVVTETLNPIWNQTFDFVVEDALHDLLMVEVWDHDTFGKDYIGRCILTLTKVILEGEFQDTFVLQGAKSGKLNLHFKWTPQPIYRDRDRDQ